MAQEAQVVLSLGATLLAALKPGINFQKNPEDGKCYLIYKDEDGLRACRNQCKHQGGLFIRDIEDLSQQTVKCTKHNWKLNMASMRYSNPPDSFSQEELEVELKGGGLQLLELCPQDPWLVEQRQPQTLEAGEATVTYLSHACMALSLGGVRVVFDPWLTGPAFGRGWWLLHQPPPDAWERLFAADFIYISHIHSDHLSYPTLKVLAERRPDIPIYVGDTSRPVFWYLKQSKVPLTNITVMPFGVWQNVNKDLRFMILMDGVHPEMDTCILLDYKGQLIMNSVDCTRPNGGRLPPRPALLMSDFAGGAAGFPMTFSGGKYTEAWKAEFVRTERRKLLRYKAQLVAGVRPQIYCPFAGYFLEAHPSDAYIRQTNKKNSAEELKAEIQKNCEDIMTWTPEPGATLDLGLALAGPPHSGAVCGPPPGAQIFKDRWDFQLYDGELSAAVPSAVFTHPDWIQHYYTWAGFSHYNLVVRVMETDADFERLAGGWDYLVDFNELTFPQSRPSRKHDYLEIRNRVEVMRYVVLNGQLWDSLYIGFQNRISRDPDVYHHRFWNHFQVELPLTPPDWDGFLRTRPDPPPTPESSASCRVA